MTPEAEKAEVWSEEDYVAIDAVAPYEPGQRYYTADEVLERARKRTQAWIQAAETTTLTA
jgi:hypothetical protein